MSDHGTIKFKIGNDNDDKIQKILIDVYNALEKKGYNPINQIVGYIISGDPTYITSFNNARNLITRIDREDLLEEITKTYLRESCGISKP